MRNQTVLVLDFGGQYKELIARRVRELGVYSVIKPGSMTPQQIADIAPIGMILTGGPNSVYHKDAPHCDKKIFSLGIPVLGICYGMQLMAWTLGAEVKSASVKEYGKTMVDILEPGELFAGLEKTQPTLMSHTDQVMTLPEGFSRLASTASCPIAAMGNPERKLYAVQFHPEVERTAHGTQMIKNFLYRICGAKGDYSMDDYIASQCEQIRHKVGQERVLLALSGGVDSSVCAALLSKAIPGQLTCIFVDHGLMRKDEGDQIEAVFSKRNLHFIRVNAQERFLSLLSGVSDPEKKRKIIGEQFIRVFEEESRKLGSVKYLAQGTIYPDVIESGANNSANIKSHHNVGGLPKDIGFGGIIEPLSGLFKDEVRKVGKTLGLPGYLVGRQPFPGPGLAIRVIGEITQEKLAILREADAIVRQEIGRLRKKPHQYFAVLTDMRSVGVMGDSRTYDYTVAVRAVNTSDFMTCTYAPLSHEVLGRISTRIVAEVPGVNRVVYDITGKPPATIEWL